ncbi:hypothetical protein LCGC14_1631910 [marine sediment metagenome]|uniref:Uncharacterized protein n=1 Tax=marine sediment metagenome TaxID=412755 RepID=A0A0F9IPJ7_9ZZZZ
MSFNEAFDEDLEKIDEIPVKSKISSTKKEGKIYCEQRKSCKGY